MRPTSAASRPPRAFRRSISRSIAPSCSRWCAPLSAAAGGMDAQDASAAAAVRALLRRQSDDGSGRLPLPNRSARIASPSPTTIPSSPCRRTRPGRSSPRSTPGGSSTETIAERTFLTVYGSPTLQAAVGIDPAGTQPLRKAAQESAASRAPAEADRRAQSGASRPAGMRAAVIRGLLYAGMPRAAIDERGFEALAPHSRGAHRPQPRRPSRRWCASSSTCC